MDTGGLNNPKLGSDSQDSDDLPQPGTSGFERPVIKFSTKNTKPIKNVPLTPKGVEQAKKRLRAFSIQKKSSLSPVSVPKPISTGNATVFIGKAAGVKMQPKPEPDPADPKKPPKPPKPGTKQPQESYILTQKKTLAEIEDMKRKMELVELGIPLGLICPARNSDKAMPTKAMPPIKTFLDSDKVDELIREAKKARAEGKEFKFDYHKLLPDYANPFQRKKDALEAPETPKSDEQDHRKSRERDKRRSDKIYEIRRHPSYKIDRDRHREDKYKDKSNERTETVREGEKLKDMDSKYKDRDSKYKEKYDKSKDRDLKLKERNDISKEKDNRKEGAKKGVGKGEKEADVDLKDFVVCDSWSDNEEKSKDSTPKLDEIKKRSEEKAKEKTPVLSLDPMDQLRDSLGKKDKQSESPITKLKRLKLNPVIDSFKFEIEDPEEDALDMFEDTSSTAKYSKVSCKEECNSPDMQLFDYDAKDETFDGMADDTFLESVINEIKQEEIDETSQDKGLVEYDESPSKDGEVRGSVTPEMDDRVRQLHSSRSDYSDSYKSTESGYKSTDSLKLTDYKSDVELERIVEERRRELVRMVEERKIAKYTVDSLETWSFVLKICQPLLFRHDRNKCYKETRVEPKLWYTENPKLCNCVKDRRVVYDELEMCKMDLVDSLCNGKQVAQAAEGGARGWYPRLAQWGAAGAPLPPPSEWEAEDSQPPRRAATPDPGGDMSLDKEYQRFMEAVWPDVAEPKSETPRSTPVRRDRKKPDDDLALDKNTKKVKSSEGWSQESDVDEEEECAKSTVPTSAAKKLKVEKVRRKRKHSTSTSVTDSSGSEPKKRKKMQKKKDTKKSKSKETKRRRVSKKNVKKLKEKQKKKKKTIEIDEDSDLQDMEKEKKKKEKRLKKKKLLKQKKKNQKKKKAKAKSSSSSDSSSDSEPEPEKKFKKKKKDSEKKTKYKKSYESQEELFDVNILKNIKTERETDDEISKQLEFSPRRQKPREIINVKELQNDFVGNSIQIKKEVEQDEKKNIEESKERTEVGLVEKQESQESQVENAKEKESLPDFKEQEESQSTPQLPVEESNHSQCSSQESIYSLKEQPAYEKDESHLRPPSQNSNYSFHDVMASGNYSKKMEHAKQQNAQRIEHEIQSYESDMNRSEYDMNRSKHDMDRSVHDMDRSVHDMNRSEHDMNRSEHDMQRCGHDVQRQEHDTQSRENEMQRHDNDRRHDISHELSVQRHESGMQSREHQMQSREHEMQSSQHEMQRCEHEMQSREHEMQSRIHEMQNHEHEMQSHEHDMDSQEYEHGNYEMYEQMAMAYQSDVASQHTSPPDGSGERRIETVVRARTCGEIKCDWRAGDGGAPPAVTPARPSRWGLKPGDVNIVLTGGEQSPAAAQPVYKIQSIANRTDNSATGYDEAYMDMYGAADKLQYGDCFSTEERGAGAGAGAGGAGLRATIVPHTSSLDARINLALRTTVLGEVASEDGDDKAGPERGILVTKSLSVGEGRAAKRVSFADGYKPGQDSDVEDPPVKKKKKCRRVGCAWPCPATHADHVPLWDALPPPPPPAGSPPPPAPGPAPPAHLLRRARPAPLLHHPHPHPHTHHPAHKFDPNSMAAFMPPEPPPGLINFQNL